MDRAPGISTRFRHLPQAAITAWTMIAACAASLLWLVLARHTVGDYGVESDFYGGYAEGARAIQQGVWDARRYVVVGPVYEVVLALLGRGVPDLFTAAKLISWLAAAGTLTLWFSLLARRVGAAPAAWVVAFLVVNPTFLRYGEAASTDMLAVFFASACLFALVVVVVEGRGRRGPLAAGALAGVAVLTRYSAVVLIPAALVLLAMRSAEQRRARALLLFSCGVLGVVGPWLVFSLAHGIVPGQGLFGGYAFYAEGYRAWNVQDRLGANGSSATIPGWREVVAARPWAYLAERARQIPIHLQGDASTLLGWPAAVAAVLGFLVIARHPRRGRLVPIAIVGLFTFVGSLAAFQSSRYSLPLLFFYAMGTAGFAWTSAVGVPALPSQLARGLGAAAILLTGVASVQAQRQWLHDAPREVIAAGRRLRGIASRGEAVMARKGHIGYYSGLPVVPLPRVTTLHELADRARGEGAHFLYYTWFETQVRPELAFLLDTTSAIPGLSVVDDRDDKPAVLYRIGPAFGQPPDWIADDFARSLHLARGRMRVEGDSAPASEHLVVAVDALLKQRWSAALHHAQCVTDRDSTQALAWAIEGEAFRRLARNDDARAAFIRAIDLDPNDPAAKIGLGRIELASGNAERAVRLLRAAAETTDDVRTLAEISAMLRGLADSTGVRDVRRELERLSATTR